MPHALYVKKSKRFHLLIKHELLEPLPSALSRQFRAYIEIETRCLGIPGVRLSRVEVNNVGDLLSAPVDYPVMAIKWQRVSNRWGEHDKRGVKVVSVCEPQ
jgi:hypothetical protein